MILVIGAMEEELAQILALRRHIIKKDFIGLEYHDLGHQYLIVISEIGICNASLSLSHWLTKYPQITEILVLGTAGSVSSTFYQGTECYIDKATYGGADTTSFGYAYGQIPKMPINYSLTFYQPFTRFLQANSQLKKANIATLDVFVHNKIQLNRLQRKLDLKFELVDMESTAFLQTAFRFNKPILIVKVVTDSLHNMKNSSLSFGQFLPQAALKISNLFESYLKNRRLLK